MHLTLDSYLVLYCSETAAGDHFYNLLILWLIKDFESSHTLHNACDERAWPPIDPCVQFVLRKTQ